MTRRMLFGLTILVAALALTDGVALQPPSDPPGCLSCHEALTEVVPDAHPTAREVFSPCLVCHGPGGAAARFAWTIHYQHYGDEAFPGDCWSCHEMASETNFALIGAGSSSIEATEADAKRLTEYYSSWAGSELTDRVHAEAGVTCASCHGTAVPASEAGDLTDQCMVCHGNYWDDLSELTREIEPNPHFISHQGPLACSDCHGAHTEVKNYCSDCH